MLCPHGRRSQGAYATDPPNGACKRVSGSVREDHDIFGKSQALLTNCNTVSLGLLNEPFRGRLLQPDLPVCCTVAAREVVRRAAPESAQTRLRDRGDTLNKVRMLWATGNDLANLLTARGVLRPKLI